MPLQVEEAHQAHEREVAVEEEAAANERRLIFRFRYASCFCFCFSSSLPHRLRGAPFAS